MLLSQFNIHLPALAKCFSLIYLENVLIKSFLCYIANCTECNNDEIANAYFARDVSNRIDRYKTRTHSIKESRE